MEDVKSEKRKSITNGHSKITVTATYIFCHYTEPSARSSRSEIELEFHIRTQDPIPGLLIVRVDMSEPADTTSWNRFKIRTFGVQ